MIVVAGKQYDVNYTHKSMTYRKQNYSKTIDLNILNQPFLNNGINNMYSENYKFTIIKSLEIRNFVKYNIEKLRFH